MRGGDMSVWELFDRGGLLMYAIAIASVVALGAFIERMAALRESRVAPKEWIAKIFVLVDAGKIVEAEAECASSTTHLAPVFAAVVRHRDEPLPLVREAGEEAGRREAARLERFVGVLGTVASVGPLLGLLGTVTGMISVFQRVAESGVSSPLEMASGIWEALVTTAFGLGVGIPALLLHRYTLSVVDKRILGLEEAAVELVARLEIPDLDDPASSTLTAEASEPDALDAKQAGRHVEDPRTGARNRRVYRS